MLAMLHRGQVSGLGWPAGYPNVPIFGFGQYKEENTAPLDVIAAEIPLLRGMQKTGEGRHRQNGTGKTYMLQ